MQLRQDVAAFIKALRPALGGQALPYVWVPEWHPEVDELQGVLERKIRQLSGGILGHPECSMLDRSTEPNVRVSLVRVRSIQPKPLQQ